MDTQKIGKFLKELRREHNMTQEELGEKIDYLRTRQCYCVFITECQKSN